MKNILRQTAHKLGIRKTEAAQIIASLVKRQWFDIYINGLNDDERYLLRLKLRQLEMGIPLAYVTKCVQFRDYELRVWPGVFIPRFETEYFIDMIEQQIDVTPDHILEIGTGTGALSIALSGIYSAARITATDISRQAMVCASANIGTYNLQDKINLVQCSLFEAISGKYQLIVSNPPYVPCHRLASLPDLVKQYEPIRALAGGPDGLTFISNILNQGMKHLTKNGLIGLEVDDGHEPVLRAFLDKNNFSTYLFQRDQFSRYRYLFVKKTL
jgi:release factor glutamine methyltransferase